MMPLNANWKLMRGLQDSRISLRCNDKAVNFVFKFIGVQSFRNRFSSYRDVMSVEEELQEVFKFRNTNLSNWIIENKARALCSRYSLSTKEEKRNILRILSSRYSIQHDEICEKSKILTCVKPDNQRQMFSLERDLKTLLTPPYQWLFIIVGRLENGVKFLVDLRKDVLDLISNTSDSEDSLIIRQLNITLQELLLLWFSVGFLHVERITWQSSCDILQKVSDYEAIHPVKNWVDLKRRVGPYRRCYIYTHPSMPREPLVVLHTALCDIIPDSVKGIQEAEERILGGTRKEITFLEEDKSKIKSAIFYSIASTQKGLQGIELGNYLIKRVATEIISEFPGISELSTLSPIPNFRMWLLEKMMQDVTQIFTQEEYNTLQSVLQDQNLVPKLKQIFNNSLWTKQEELMEALKTPLVRSCAWYLYREKHRNYALNKVANFHLRNGAVMWRINWFADPSPRGVGNSFGIMVNYRYYLDESETNSRNYIENYFVNASEDVISLAAKAEKMILKSSKLHSSK